MAQVERLPGPNRTYKVDPTMAKRHGGKVVTVRVSPFHERQLKQVARHGLPPGATPRSISDVIRDAIRYYHACTVAQAPDGSE